MSNDCGFLANIKEEGTKNTYAPLCQNSTALGTYQANMLEHFQRERDRTTHQGQSHFIPSPGLSPEHRRRDQAPSAAPNSYPAAGQERGGRRRPWRGPRASWPQSHCPPPRPIATGPRQHGQAVCLLRCQLPEAEAQRATETPLLPPPKLLDSKPQAAAEGLGQEKRCGGGRARRSAVPQTHTSQGRAGLAPGWPGELAPGWGLAPRVWAGHLLLTKSQVGPCCRPRRRDRNHLIVRTSCP